MLRLALGTGTLVLLLSSTCLGQFPDADSPEQERLAAAIKSGDLAVVKAAAEAAALHDVYALRGNALKNYVLGHGSGEIVRYLNRKAHLGIQELQMAVLDDDLENAKAYIVENLQRPPVAHQNTWHSPLRLAVRRGNAAMVKLLIDANTAVNESVLEFGPPESMIPPVLVEAIQLGNAEIVRLLAEAGATLEKPEAILRPKPGATYEGKTVEEVLKLFWSRFVGSQDYERIAAEKEALYKELDAQGLLVREPVHRPNANAPLALAIAGGREKIVAVLLDAGASPNVNVGGETRPLHLAVRKGHPGIVRLLLKAGADVNQSDAEGRTPLGLASSHGDIADMLRAAGAKAPPMFREDEIPAPRIKEIELEPAPDDFGGREMARAN